MRCAHIRTAESGSHGDPAASFEEIGLKGGNKLFLFAGVGLALVAVLLGITMTSGGGDKADATRQELAPTKISIVRLLQDIEQHQVIKADMVETVEMDPSLAPTDAVTVPANVIDQSYTLKASARDVLRQEFVAPPGITSAIEPGMRAMSVAVDSQGSMSGLVVAGDYIDVVFEARVDLNRILDFGGLEFYEDEYYKITNEGDGSSGSGGSGDDGTSGDGGSSGADDDTDDQGGFPLLGIDPSPYQGTDGSTFTATDGGDFLEPVAKMLIQDVKIIRVIPAGTTYDGQGQQVQAVEENGAPEEELGQLIIQVTPQQAEAVAFIQSEHHSYSIAVRGKDDHAVAQTTGVTFQILMSDGTWSMPWPEPIVAEDAREQRGAPTAGQTPTVDPAEDQTP